MSTVPTASHVVNEFMDAFIGAWPTGDASNLGRFFSEDAVFRNGPLPPVEGREAILASFAHQMHLGGQVSADIRHILAEGPVVMTERVDYVKMSDRTLSLRIMGIFEVHNGLITAWRDYFDSNEFAAQLSDDTNSDP